MRFLKRLLGRQDDEPASLYSIPNPVSSGPFKMTIDDIFVISNRGIVLTGRVKRGSLQKGDAIEIRNQTIQVQTEVVSIESFHKKVDIAKQGDNIGILLPKDVPRSVLFKDMIVIKQGDS